MGTYTDYSPTNDGVYINDEGGYIHVLDGELWQSIDEISQNGTISKGQKIINIPESKRNGLIKAILGIIDAHNVERPM